MRDSCIARGVIIRDYYMMFSISALVLAWDSHIKPDSEAGGLIWVLGLILGTIWKISCHNLFITYFTLTFSKHWLLYCKKNLWTDKIFKRVAVVQLANIFVSSLVSKIYQTMSICTRTLETVCKIDPRRWHLNWNSYSTRRIHLS